MPGEINVSDTEDDVDEDDDDDEFYEDENPIRRP